MLWIRLNALARSALVGRLSVIFALFLAAAMFASAGCRHAPICRSQFYSADAAPPVAAVPESSYWCLPTGDDGFPSIADDFCRSLPYEPPLAREPGNGWQYCCADVASFCPRVWQDQKHYYSWDGLGLLCIGFGAGALVANTDWDRDISDWHQRQVRSRDGDRFADICKGVGNGAYAFPVIGGAWLLGDIFFDTPSGSVLGEWGQRGMRTALVGAPPMLLMQYVTGSSRPVELDKHSYWEPFTDNNGVSGHAFIGAIPFICAAQMTEELLPKIGLYAVSTLPAWSRVNDNAHYTSQSIIGWWMAYCAATAVDATYQREREWSVTPLPMADGLGMAISYQY